MNETTDSWRQLQRHELNVYPLMQDDERADLKKALQSNGYNPAFPITIHDDAIIDGMQRFELCKELDIEPTIVRFEGTMEEVADFITESNVRRATTPAQRASIAVEMDGLIEGMKAEARARSNANLKQNEPTGLIEPAGRTAERLGDKYGVGASSIKRAGKVLNSSPELHEAVKRGDVSLNEAFNKVNGDAKQRSFEDDLNDEAERVFATLMKRAVLAQKTRILREIRAEIEGTIDELDYLSLDINLRKN